MKKHADALSKVKSEDLMKTAETLRADLIALKKGVRMGDVQNYKQFGTKRKELARVMTRVNKERKEK